MKGFLAGGKHIQLIKNRAIEATLALATSDNSQIIVIKLLVVFLTEINLPSYFFFELKYYSLGNSNKCSLMASGFHQQINNQIHKSTIYALFLCPQCDFVSVVKLY